MSTIKNILREVFISLHLDLTKNLKYDRLTRRILKKYLKKDYNCIDVGCHKGEILDLILKYSPEGEHYAFEPLPYLFKELAIKYKDKVKVFRTHFQIIMEKPFFITSKMHQHTVA